MHSGDGGDTGCGSRVGDAASALLSLGGNALLVLGLADAAGETACPESLLWIRRLPTISKARMRDELAAVYAESGMSVQRRLVALRALLFRWEALMSPSAPPRAEE